MFEALDKPRVIKHKSGALDLVTETDEASEKAVLQVLRSHFPDHAVLGEEGGVSGDPATGLLWCVPAITFWDARFGKLSRSSFPCATPSGCLSSFS